MIETNRKISVRHIIDIFDKIWPPNLQESWDNTGLLISPSDPSNHYIRNKYLRQIRPKILLTIDLTPKVINEAIRRQFDIVWSYHPAIFKDLGKTIKWDTDKTLIECIKNDIFVYSPHTRIDNLPENSINQCLIDAILKDTGNKAILQFHFNEFFDKLIPILKLTYDDSPDEIIIESDSKINLMKDIAFNLNINGNNNNKSSRNIEIIEDSLFVSKNDDLIKQKGGPLIIYTQKPLNIIEIVQKLKIALKIDNCMISSNSSIEELANEYANSIAICVGSGSSVFKKLISCNIDLYITGEMPHHDQLNIINSSDNQPSIILTGHSESERYYLEIVQKQLEDTFKDHGYLIEVNRAKMDHSLLNYY